MKKRVDYSKQERYERGDERVQRNLRDRGIQSKQTGDRALFVQVYDKAQLGVLQKLIL